MSRFVRPRLLVFLTLLVAACAGGPSKDEGSLVAVSRAWIKPEFNDIQTTITLSERGERRYAMHLSSSSTRGLDPSNRSLGVFMRCVARSFAAKRGFEGWSIGIPPGKGDELVTGAKEIEMTLVLVNRGEKPESFASGDLAPVVYNDAQLRDRCAGVIRPEFM